ncbi:uncharacterized protein LOC121877266 [Homarus americanus]|uniref:uncharacterized protein LOC121877266 n=1 Tax=Homarus americanus TaxID=6706 RepID=UPI001C47D5E2|nr:uncharacterized protein LOC121877266 [Homarus americanus]
MESCSNSTPSQRTSLIAVDHHNAAQPQHFCNIKVPDKLVMGRLWFFLVVTLMAASSFYVEAQLTEPCTTEDASACADGVLNNIFQLEPVASDCSTYCKCTGQGRGIVLACPPLLFFDKSLRVCSFQRNC